MQHERTIGVVSGLRDQPPFGPVVQVTAPISHGNSGGPLLDAEGHLVGVISYYLEGGQNLNFGIAASTLRTIMDKPRELTAFTSLSAGKAVDPSTPVGILDSVSGTVQVTVPKRAPFSVATPTLHTFDPKSITVQVKDEMLTRVDNPSDVGKGQFAVSDLGVVTLHESLKQKRILVKGKYRTFKVAVSVTGDPSNGDLQEILRVRLERTGDKVTVGAEVDAAMARLREQGSGTRALAKTLGCGLLVVAWTGSNIADHDQYTLDVATTVSLTIYDLNTGQRLYEESTSSSGNVGKLRSWRKLRRDEVESCVAALLSGK